jgi:hypothetical protein
VVNAYSTIGVRIENNGLICYEGCCVRPQLLLLGRIGCHKSQYCLDFYLFMLVVFVFSNCQTSVSKLL